VILYYNSIKLLNYLIVYTYLCFVRVAWRRRRRRHTYWPLACLQRHDVDAQEGQAPSAVGGVVCMCMWLWAVRQHKNESSSIYFYIRVRGAETTLFYYFGFVRRRRRRRFSTGGAAWERQATKQSRGGGVVVVCSLYLYLRAAQQPVQQHN